MMDFSLDNLRALSDRMQQNDSTAQQLRDELEGSLVPIIRRALRGGKGLPQLVSWVRRHLPTISAGRGRPDDVEGAVPSLARLLCDTLLLRTRPQPAMQAACDTVWGW
jgi:hypothetical protein